MTGIIMIKLFIIWIYHFYLTVNLTDMYYSGIYVILFVVLFQFCINQPVIHIVAEANCRNILKDANVIKTINENVAFDYPHSSMMSLDDKYSRRYYSTEVSLVC